MMRMNQHKKGDAANANDLLDDDDEIGDMFMVDDEQCGVCDPWSVQDPWSGDHQSLAGGCDTTKHDGLDYPSGALSPVPGTRALEVPGWV